jgi:MarR family.
MLTERQVKVILILLDNEGHAGWELANILEMSNSNLNPILKKLEQIGIICQGDARRSTQERKKHKEGDYKEFPYYLSNNLDNIKTMIKELIQSGRILDTGFVLEIIKKSRYIKTMRRTFGKDLTKTIADEVRESYPPYANSRFKVIRQLVDRNKLNAPFLEEDFEESIENGLEDPTEKHLERDLKMPSELELWYDKYLSNRLDQE